MALSGRARYTYSNTQPLGSGFGEAGGPDAVGVDREQFAGFDLADERGADDVEGGGLAGDHPAAIEPARDTADAHRAGRAPRRACARP